MLNLGTVKPGSTVYVPFDTFAGSTGASVTMTGLAVTDIEVYKDGSVTQRASDAGYTLLDTDGIDFDGLTGIHGFSISLADNTTAGFWAAGSDYFVVVSAITVDSQTVSFVAARFRIGYPDAILDTTIATLASQTSFTLTAGPAEDDALNGCVVLIHDVASAVQMGWALVADYTGSTRTVTLAAGTTFTAATTDSISVFMPRLLPTVAGRTLDVSAGGEAGIDWANVGTPGSTVSLSATTVATVTTTTTATNLTNLPTIPANWLTAAGTASDFGTEVATAVWASGTRTLTSLSGLTVDTVTTLTNLPAITANWLTAAGTAADFGTEVGTAVWATAARTLTALDEDSTTLDLDATIQAAVDARFDSLDTAVAGVSSPTAAAIADAVWDEAIAGHLTAGTTGASLNGAGSAGDPWTTSLPGAYGAGTAGFIVGTNLNATVSSRSSHTAANVVTELGTGSTLTALATAAEVADINTTLTTLLAATTATQDLVADVPTNAELATALDALPTAAEVVTALGTGSTLTALATAASVTTLQTGVDAVPTNAELSSALAGGVALIDGAITEAKITTPAEASGRPTGILGMIRRVFESSPLGNKKTRNRTTGALSLRNAADNGNLATATQSTASSTDTQTAGA